MAVKERPGWAVPGRKRVNVMSTSILTQTQANRKPTEPGIFEKIKGIGFPDIFDRFCGADVRSGKALCPFHDDRNPSFAIYPDGGHCFACGWHGDGVDLVGELRNLPPINAARLIAQEFNLSVTTGKKRLPPIENKQRLAAAREREARSRYKLIQEMAFLALAEFRDLAVQVFSEDKLEVEPDLVGAIHLIPLIEHYLETLATGSEEQVLELLREGVLQRWAKLRSYQTRI